MRRWTARDEAVMRALHDLGQSIPQIAEYLERDRGVVHRHVRDAGLEIDGAHHLWTPDDDETIRLNFPMWPAFLVAYLIGCSETALYQRAAKIGVEKDPNHWRNPHAHLWAGFSHPNSIAARIKPGSTPPNKGLRRPGYAPGRMAQTQFKKGRPARLSRNYVPIGTEKYDRKRGVVVRKITDDPKLFPVMRWRPVHVLIWEAVHGPVPKGHIVRFKKGMKTLVSAEISIDRLELVTLAENMRRNSYHNNYPKDVALAIQAKAMLTRTINRKTREQAHER